MDGTFDDAVTTPKPCFHYVVVKLSGVSDIVVTLHLDIHIHINIDIYIHSYIHKLFLEVRSSFMICKSTQGSKDH